MVFSIHFIRLFVATYLCWFAYPASSQIEPEATKELHWYFPGTNIQFVESPTQLQSAIVTCYARNAEGDIIDGSQGLVVGEGLVLTSVTKLIDSASITVKAQCCDERDAEGIVAFDLRTGLAYVSVPGIEAKPYTGGFEQMPDDLPDSFDGIYGLPFSIEGGSGVATMSCETITDWQHGSYPRTVIINNAYKALGAGGLILGPNGTPCGMVAGGAGGSHAIAGGSNMGVVPIACHDQLVRLDQPIDGIELFDAAPDNIAKAMILAEIATSTRRSSPAQAGAIAESALKLDDTNSEAWYELGVCYDLLGKKPEARSALRKSVVHDPTWSESWYSLGLVQLTSSQYQDAAITLRNSTKYNRFHTKAYGMLGLALMRSSSENEAIDALTRACILQPSNPQFAINLTTSLTELDRTDEIPDVWMRYVDSNREDPHRWMAALVEVSQSGQYESYIEIAQQAQDIFGEDDIILGAIAMKHLLQEEFDEADKYARKAIELDSDDYLAKGVVYVLNNKRANKESPPPP